MVARRVFEHLPRLLRETKGAGTTRSSPAGGWLLREVCRFVRMPGENYRDKVITPGLSV